MGLDTLRKVLFINEGMSGFSFFHWAWLDCSNSYCTVMWYWQWPWSWGQLAFRQLRTSWIVEERQGKDLCPWGCNQAAELTQSDSTVCQDFYLHAFGRIPDGIIWLSKDFVTSSRKLPNGCIFSALITQKLGREDTWVIAQSLAPHHGQVQNRTSRGQMQWAMSQFLMTHYLPCRTTFQSHLPCAMSPAFRLACLAPVLPAQWGKALSGLRQQRVWLRLKWISSAWLNTYYMS